MQLSQHRLIIEYVKRYGSILPAKMGGMTFLKTMFGSETPKRCRELRAKKLLKDFREDRFVGFVATEQLKKIY
jgi:hypothetical protein